MSVIPAVKATGLERELLDAFIQLQEARSAYTTALARYDQARTAIEEQDHATD